MPEISVIVPVYKAELYLNRCIDSILAQTFEDFELILVDDGSPDGSGAICDEYAEKDVRVQVIHKKNGGVSSARNTGLRKATGQWITFVDSDDYVSQTYLRDIYEPEYDITVVGHQIVGPDGDMNSYSLVPFQTEALSDADMKRMLSDNGSYWVIFCWGRSFRREMLVQNGILFDETLRCGEDYVFTATCLNACKALCLKDDRSYIHLDRGRESLSKTFDIPFFENLVRSETMVGQIMSERFPTSFRTKSDKEITQLFADGLASVAGDRSFSFRKKYQIFKYLFRSPQLTKAVDDPQQYFAGTSKYFVALIRVGSPLLMLLGLMISIRIKNKQGR